MTGDQLKVCSGCDWLEGVVLTQDLPRLSHLGELLFGVAGAGQGGGLGWWEYF